MNLRDPREAPAYRLQKNRLLAIVDVTMSWQRFDRRRHITRRHAAADVHDGVEEAADRQPCAWWTVDARDVLAREWLIDRYAGDGWMFVPPSLPALITVRHRDLFAACHTALTQVDPLASASDWHEGGR